MKFDEQNPQLLPSLFDIYSKHEGKQSDKWKSYLYLYDNLFKELRNKSINLLEIGVQNGGSLEIWSKYFYKALNIMGCEINKEAEKLLFHDSKIALIIGDINDLNTRKKIIERNSSFDIIIDDGSHSSQDIIRSFYNYFPMLENDGFYIVEDLHCSYWPEFEGGLFNPLSSMQFFKSLADIINYEHWGIPYQIGDFLKGFESKYGIRGSLNVFSSIHSISFANSTCVVRKSSSDKNFLGYRMVVGNDSLIADLKPSNHTYSIPPELSLELILAQSPILQVEELKQSVSVREATISDLSREVQDRENLITELKQSVSVREATISDLSREVQDRENLITELKQSVSVREATISDLSREVQDRENLITELKQSVSVWEATISDLNREVQDREGQIAELNLFIKDKDNQLLQLNLNIQSILSSTSYQLTRPLRKIGKYLPLPLKRVIRRSAKAAYWVLTPHKIPERLKQIKVRNLKNKFNFNGLINRNWYLQRYPDVAEGHQDPVDHYLIFGFKESRDPNPLFDTDWYLSQNPDVADSGVNPLQHYMEYGVKEGRNPNPLFDTDWYLSRNPDVAESGVNPLQHYLEYGVKEGRDPNPLFDTDWYLSQYTDVAKSGINPLQHYMEYGVKEGRDPNPAFDTKWYLEINLDVKLSGVIAFEHFVKIGAAEGRLPFRDFDFDFYRSASKIGDVSNLEAYRHYVSCGRLAGIPFRCSNDEVQIEPPLKIYDAWVEVNRWNSRQEAHLRGRLAEVQDRLPKISILMPVYNTPVIWLRRAIDSVKAQIYDNWELCISDNCSTDMITKKFLRSLDGQPKISLSFLPENVHISRNTNNAAQLATGEFLIFLDSDDELTADCLAEIALYVANNPKTDFLYSDTDKIDEQGRRFDPAFKPDWSPEMLLSFMYAGQVLAVKCSLFEKLGGLRPGYEGSQDHDFALRAGEQAIHVGHIPKVLYHWRSIPGSTARSGNEKPYAVVAGQKAVQEALERRGSRGIAVQPEWAKKGGNSLFNHKFPDEGPTVSVIIPTGGNVKLLEKCLKGLFEETRYPILEIIILFNNSTRQEAFPYFEKLSHDPRVRIIDSKGDFNFSRICNLGASAARGEYILLLNDDIVVIEPHWLSNMMGYAQLEGVGAVGAQLRYEDGRIQHAGVVHGFHDGLAGHAFKLLPRGENGYLSMVEVLRNYSAVTAACLLTRRSLYLEIGGLDEENFGVAYNDPDYCYRLLQRGYRVVYAPGATLIHLENATRNKVDNPREIAAFRERYGTRIDPYYNPNLSLEDEQFNIQPRCVVLGKSPDIRTAVFTHNLNWEGAPISQYQLVCELKRQGIIEPVVFSPLDGPMRATYETAGCQVIVGIEPINPKASLVEYNKGVVALAEKLRSLKIELVYANTLDTYYAIDVARKLRFPAVWNVRESQDWRHYYDGFSPQVRSRIYQNFAYPYRVIFVAHATRRRFSELNTRHNFTVIHNGLDLYTIETGLQRYTRPMARQLLGLSDDDVVFLALGTVCERKGQLELIESVMKLNRGHWKSLHMLIVGDRPGPYSKDLHTLVQFMPEWARQRTHVVPETEDTALYYRSADVFVFTSRVESYPRVIMEAMAYSLPIITTPVFGVSEQVMEGVNALIYQPGKPADLADHMKTFIENSDLRERMATASPHVLRSLPSFGQVLKVL